LKSLGKDIENKMERNFSFKEILMTYRSQEPEVCKFCNKMRARTTYCSLCSGTVCYRCQKKFGLCPDHYKWLTTSEKTKVALDGFLKKRWKVIPYIFVGIMLIIPGFIFPEWAAANMSTYITLAIVSMVLAITSIILLLLYKNRTSNKLEENIIDRLKEKYQQEEK